MANETELETLAADAERKRIPVARFYEPDRGDELTAIALGPRAKSLVARLPLTLGKRTNIDASSCG